MRRMRRRRRQSPLLSTSWPAPQGSEGPAPPPAPPPPPPGPLLRYWSPPLPAAASSWPPAPLAPWWRWPSGGRCCWQAVCQRWPASCRRRQRSGGGRRCCFRFGCGRPVNRRSVPSSPRQPPGKRKLLSQTYSTEKYLTDINDVEWVYIVQVTVPYRLMKEWENTWRISYYQPVVEPLKVPKCDIFENSDFDDFYTIKSLWGATFGLK